MAGADSTFYSQFVNDADAVIRGKANVAQTENVVADVVIGALAAFALVRGCRSVSRFLSSEARTAAALAKVADVGPPKNFAFKGFRSELWTTDEALLKEAAEEQKMWERMEKGQTPRTNVTRDVSLTEPPKNMRGEGVGQGAYGIGPIDKPVATWGASTCGALVVHDLKASTHYLAHIDVAVTRRQILESLQQFNLGEVNSYFLKGYDKSSVESTVIEAYRNSGALKRLKFVKLDGEQAQGLISHKGKLYKMTRDIRSWPEFKLPLGNEAAAFEVMDNLKM